MSHSDPAAELAFLLRHLRQGVWRLDPYGRVLEVNETLARWLETPSRELAGRYAGDFIPDLPQVNFDADEEEVDVEMVTPSGLRRFARVVSFSIGDGNLLQLVTDLTAEHVLSAKLVEEARRLSARAHTDPLTGLGNRRRFDDALGSVTANHGPVPYAVIVADLDGLKTLNDTYGHATGDLALVEFARRLKHAVRETDVVCRVGGDEFAVLLPATTPVLAETVLKRIRDHTNGPLATEHGEVDLIASFGLAHRDEGPSDVWDRADRRMYEDKRRPRA